MNRPSFRTVVHCDWSMRPRGRWMARAHRDDAGRWLAEGPAPVPDGFVDRLFGLAAAGPTLAAFDVPIGLPLAYGERTGFRDFGDALEGFGHGPWSDIHRVAATADEIGLHRPFYPSRPGGTRREHLLAGHGVSDIAALTRICERGGEGLPGAGCMFWTLGAKQVGKAALDAWRNVIGPARRRGARLWPFDGDLDVLAADPLTLCESYPGDAYGQIGLSLSGLSKRRQDDRRSLAAPLLGWCAARDIGLDPVLGTAIREGFPAAAGQDDGFDAVVGLLAAIAVVDRLRPEGAPADERIRRWEGWILGRAAVG